MNEAVSSTEPSSKLVQYTQYIYDNNVWHFGYWCMQNSERNDSYHVQDCTVQTECHITEHSNFVCIYSMFLTSCGELYCAVTSSNMHIWLCHPLYDRLGHITGNNLKTQTTNYKQTLHRFMYHPYHVTIIIYVDEMLKICDDSFQVFMFACYSNEVDFYTCFITKVTQYYWEITLCFHVNLKHTCTVYNFGDVYTVTALNCDSTEKHKTRKKAVVISKSWLRVQTLSLQVFLLYD